MNAASCCPDCAHGCECVGEFASTDGMPLEISAGGLTFCVLGVWNSQIVWVHTRRKWPCARTGRGCCGLSYPPALVQRWHLACMPNSFVGSFLASLGIMIAQSRPVPGMVGGFPSHVAALGCICNAAVRVRGLNSVHDQ